MEPIEGDTPVGEDIEVEEFLMNLPGMELKKAPSVGTDPKGKTLESLRKK